MRCLRTTHLEALQKITDKPLAGSARIAARHALRRLMSAPCSSQGSGWYETDFKSDKENKRNLGRKGKGEAKADAAEYSDAG